METAMNYGRERFSTLNITATTIWVATPCTDALLIWRRFPCLGLFCGVEW